MGRRLTSEDIRESGILKHYKIIRRWFASQYGMKQTDLELLIFLDSVKYFTIKDFKEGVYTYTWDKNRWSRLRKEMITPWRHKNNTTHKFAIYKVSNKGQRHVKRLMRMMAGEEPIPTSIRNKATTSTRYKDKVMTTSIHVINKDYKNLNR